MTKDNLVIVGENKSARFKEYLSSKDMIFSTCPDYRKMNPLLKKDAENYVLFFKGLSDDDYLYVLEELALYPGKTHLAVFDRYTENGISFSDKRRSDKELSFDFSGSPDELYDMLGRK